MLERLSPTARNVSLAVLGLLVLWFGWTVRSVLNPLIFGYLLAYVIHPGVLKLERRGWSRSASVNLIFCFAFVAGTVIMVGLFFQGRMLVNDVVRDDGIRQRIEQRFDQALVDHEEKLEWLVEMLEDEGAPDPAEEGEGSDEEAGAGAEEEAQVEEEPLEIDELLAALWHEIFSGERAVQAGEVGLRAAGRSWGVLSSVFGSVVAFFTFVFLLPIYTYFLLFELGRIHRFVTRYMPRRERKRLSRVGGQIGEVLASFFRGRLLVCLLKGLILALGLWALGVDYAFLVGLASGFLSLIPFVGPMIGAVAAGLLGLMEHTVVGSIWRVAVVFVTAEVLEGYVLVPKVIGDSLGLHPVVVLASVFVGGAALGMFGFLIALPLTATIVILVREFVLPALAEFADEEEGVGAT